MRHSEMIPRRRQARPLSTLKRDGRRKPLFRATVATLAMIAFLATSIVAPSAWADGLTFNGFRVGSDDLLYGARGDAAYQPDNDTYGMMVDFSFGAGSKKQDHSGVNDIPVANMSKRDQTFWIIVVTCGIAFGIAAAAASNPD